MQYTKTPHDHGCNVNAQHTKLPDQAPPTRHLHVFIPIQAQPHRPLQVVSRHRSGAVQEDGAGLLAAEAAADALGLADNAVLGDAQHVRHEGLVLGGRLRAK